MTMRKLFKQALVTFASGLLLAGCSVSNNTPSEPSPSTDAETTVDNKLNELTSIACQDFFGDDKTYQYSLSSDLLANAGSAKYDNIQDPYLFEITIESMQEVFKDSAVEEQSDKLIDWLANEAVKGEAADLSVFESAYTDLASHCSDYSVAADWIDFDESDEPGTKPAVLVCSEIFSTPMTLKVYYNQNVLTSNMFKDAGLYPKDMSNSDPEQLKRTYDYITEQSNLVDDPAVKEGLLNIRKPYDNALNEGNYWSEGMNDLLNPLEDSCIAAGYNLVQ